MYIYMYVYIYVYIKVPRSQAVGASDVVLASGTCAPLDVCACG